nr:MAG TPA: hypothetical protein [Caudoviricetes sp.]
MQLFITFLTSVCVPIVVALISSGTFANKLSKKIRVDELLEQFNELNYKVDCNKADTCRMMILDFNGEIKRGIHHDEEQFNEVISLIDKYERFCRNNPNYPNNKAVLAIENIKNVYKKAYSKNDF